MNLIFLSVFVALVIWRAKRMRCVTLPSAACLSLPQLFALSHEWYNFRVNVIDHEARVLIFSINLV
jgi:hypothetical protein